MFIINYRIVESYKRLKEMDAATYDREWANIEGLIELQFEEDSIGYMYYDEITTEMYEAGCFQDELLVSWFNNLLDTVVALQKLDYVILYEMESPKFIEIYKSGEQLLFKENIEELKKCKTIDDMPLIDRLIISFKTFKNTGHFRFAKCNKEELVATMKGFKETTILQSEFEQEVLAKSIQFVDEIANQYPWLMPSRTFIALKERIENVRVLIRK